MDKYVNLFKKHVIHFKLDLCCFMASVRSGLLAFACLHIAIGIATLMFFAEESFEPLLLKALNGIAEDPPNYGPSCMIVYAIELGSNVLLLCGTIRNDLVLLRVFLYFGLGVLTASLLVYSVLFGPQEIAVKCLILFSIGHQIYILLLVRSAMIELKQAAKNDYSVNYRHSSVRHSRPSDSRDRYSVVIEPYRRSSLVSIAGRPPYRRSSSLVPLERELYRRNSSIVLVDREQYRRSGSLVPLADRDGRNSLNQETIRPIVRLEKENEETGKEATVTVHSPKEVVKEEVEKDGESKEDLTKDSVKAKRKRSFFGKKEKVKKSEQATNDTGK